MMLNIRGSAIFFILFCFIQFEVAHGKKTDTVEFVVSVISVNNTNWLFENDGEGNYTIEEGADVTLICQYTLSEYEKWFLEWTHPKSTKEHVKTSLDKENEDGSHTVERNLTITNIHCNESGSYRCTRKKRGRMFSHDDHAPVVINIDVGTCSGDTASSTPYKAIIWVMCIMMYIITI